MQIILETDSNNMNSYGHWDGPSFYLQIKSISSWPVSAGYSASMLKEGGQVVSASDIQNIETLKLDFKWL